MRLCRYVQTEAFAKQQEEKIQAEGQVVADAVYYMHQTVGNACGTVGLLHAIGNMRQHVTLGTVQWLICILVPLDHMTDRLVCALYPDPESYLGKMFSKTKTKTPAEIADYLEHDNEVRSFCCRDAHKYLLDRDQRRMLRYYYSIGGVHSYSSKRRTAARQTRASPRYTVLSRTRSSLDFTLYISLFYIFCNL